MVIGQKVKFLREQKNMSQDDIEKRTGLLRGSNSRAANGHTVPSVDTLEKMARALEIPIYRLFTDEDHVKKPNIPAEIMQRRAASST
ncbi:MAG TPA: helix-turn-helix transcriptional regulator [Candidatus Acidoferrales bacterium]